MALASDHAARSVDDAEFLRTAPRPLGVAAWHDALVPASLDALADDAIQLLSLAGDETFWVTVDEAQGAARCTLERLAMDVLHFHAARRTAADHGLRVVGAGAPIGRAGAGYSTALGL